MGRNWSEYVPGARSHWMAGGIFPNIESILEALSSAALQYAGGYWRRAPSDWTAHGFGQNISLSFGGAPHSRGGLTGGSLSAARCHWVACAFLRNIRRLFWAPAVAAPELGRALARDALRLVS